MGDDRFFDQFEEGGGSAQARSRAAARASQSEPRLSCEQLVSSAPQPRWPNHFPQRFPTPHSSQSQPPPGPHARPFVFVPHDQEDVRARYRTPLTQEDRDGRANLKVFGGVCLVCSVQRRKCDTNVVCKPCEKEHVQSEKSFLAGLAFSPFRRGENALSLSQTEFEFSIEHWFRSVGEGLLNNSDRELELPKLEYLCFLDNKGLRKAWDIKLADIATDANVALSGHYNLDDGRTAAVFPERYGLSDEYVELGPMRAVPSKNLKKPRTYHARHLARAICHAFTFLRSLSAATIVIPVTMNLINVKTVLLLFYRDVYHLLVAKSEELSAFILESSKRDFTCCVRGSKPEFILAKLTGLADYQRFLYDLAWVDVQKLPNCVRALHEDLKLRGEQVTARVWHQLNMLRQQIETLGGLEKASPKASQKQVEQANDLLQLLHQSISRPAPIIDPIPELKMVYLPVTMLTSTALNRAADVKRWDVLKVLCSNPTKHDTIRTREANAQTAFVSNSAPSLPTPRPSITAVTRSALNSLNRVGSVRKPRRSASRRVDHASQRPSQQDTDNETRASEYTFTAHYLEQHPLDTDTDKEFELVTYGKGAKARTGDPKRSHSTGSESSPVRKRACSTDFRGPFVLNTEPLAMDPNPMARDENRFAILRESGSPPC